MRRIALTLIELLVVITTIVLFVAILLPSLRISKQEAEAIMCSSNIRQILCKMFNYENENQALPNGFCIERDKQNKRINPPGDNPGNNVYDRAGWWWLNYISDDPNEPIDKKRIFWCPSRQIRAPHFAYVLHGNYGVNYSICKSPDARAGREEFKGTAIHSSIPRASETLLIVDSGYALISWWHATDKPPTTLGNTIIENTAYIPGLSINKNRNLLIEQKRDAINGRHLRRTVNVGFVDGHVLRMKADDLFVEKTETGYRNKSPLWVPK